MQRDGRKFKTEATAGASAIQTDECPRNRTKSLASEQNDDVNRITLDANSHVGKI